MPTPPDDPDRTFLLQPDDSPSPPTPMSDSADPPARLGDFVLGEALGSGAMGTVYRATRQSTGREVAVKVLHGNLAALPGFLRRFDPEVRTMGRLVHPNIVRCLAAGSADGRSDLFALGGVLYACLTGGPPFAGGDLLALLRAKEIGAFDPPSRLNKLVPASVDKMMAKLLAKLPEHRYQSAADFLQDAEWGGFALAPLTLP